MKADQDSIEARQGSVQNNELQKIDRKRQEQELKKKNNSRYPSKLQRKKVRRTRISTNPRKEVETTKSHQKDKARLSARKTENMKTTLNSLKDIPENFPDLVWTPPFSEASSSSSYPKKKKYKVSGSCVIFQIALYRTDFFSLVFFQVDKTTMNELELFRLLKEYALALDIETTETTLT